MKKFKFLSVLAITSLLFTFLACSSPNSTTKGDDTNSAKGVINGKVVYENAGTNTDLSGINVYLEKLEDENRSAVISDSVLSGRTATAVYYASTVTNTDGSYKFDKLPDGNYTVYAVSKEEAAVRSATIVDGGTITVEDLKLVLKGSLSGTLKVTGGDVAGSLVGVAGTSYIAFVGTDGKFTISGIPAGDYKLCVMTNGKYQAFDTNYTVNGKTTANAGIISVTIEAESTGNTSSGIKYVTVQNVEQGIQFSGTILSNIYSDVYRQRYSGQYSSGYNSMEKSEAHATISILNTTLNVEMRQDYVQNSEWESWNLVFPLVEKGKEYDFRVRVYFGGYTSYQEDFTITAENGLGEIIVENTDKIQTVLDDDRVVKRTPAPELTENKNLKILKQGNLIHVYRDELWTGLFIYEARCWNENYGGTLPLKKIWDIGGWRTFENADALMRGHNYVIYGYTILSIAGFTYNDTVIFIMNDQNDIKQSTGKWGGEKQKVAVIFGEELSGNDEILDLPGEKKTLIHTYKDEEGETVSESQNVKVKIIDYGDTIAEPLNVPYLKNGESKFLYWTNDVNNGGKISFPYDGGTGYNSGEDETYTIDNQKISYVWFVLPKFSEE